uniref:Uncharacterized protein n=1 Tax=Setaria digitata TaxID=48799 RepID=A0A915Q598_9BILA
MLQMCLHTRGTSKWDSSKTCSGDKKTLTEDNKLLPKEVKDTAVNFGKDAGDTDRQKEEKHITELPIIEGKKPTSDENHGCNKPKPRKMDFSDKNRKQNEVKQKLINSFIAEITQKSGTSRSGKAKSTCKQCESVIRDNTLEEIPRDMPKYDSL